MICEHCGSYMPDDAITCDVCGSLLTRQERRPTETGVRAIRQGRKNSAPMPLDDEARTDVPVYGDFDMSPLPVEHERGVQRKNARASRGDTSSFGASRPDTRRGVPVRGSVKTRSVVSKHGKAKIVKAHPVNWMLIGVICVVLAMCAGAAYYLYMHNSDEGQRSSARKIVVSANESMLELATAKDVTLPTEREALLKSWNGVPAQAYWLVGNEYLDFGDMEDGIMALRIADVLDPENYDGLCDLGTAYELNNQDDKAEEVYLNLIENISPSRSEAYTSLINMYLDTGREVDAANMMLLAYDSTGRDSFRTQRRDFIPNTPQVDTEHTSGRYELEQTITVTSPQGYDIYYTLDDSVELPEGGTLVENDQVVIPEGTFTLRAVCVSGALVSDLMSVNYTVYYPTPAAPKCNLAPNTYNSLREVSLRAGDTGETKAERAAKTAEQLAKQDDLTFYYTIDGSTPDAEISPIYDGTPIKLPSGKVTLKAVAVNGYGKQSAIMEVAYKFNAKPALEKMYAETDLFGNFKLNTTSEEDFKADFGQPTSTVSTTYLQEDTEAQHLEYDWGYAVFTLTNNKWSVVRVEMTRDIASMPRGVGIGSSESEIAAAYKDVGMPSNRDGSRNLYYSDPQIAKIYQNDDGTRTMQYQCATADSKTWVLQYHLKNGNCYKVDHYYLP